ncbi:expressed hypothetical protein [Trichoplax adhaerens]|uniref:Ribokinase n=1 Tax=Trichoplax adhaerens TaxID=10228 RepID=B3S6D9_TRIAD|nr:expressed hypothetical protein [Trichoplax adhaerens]EDV21742.1 expressed hypothetical protein [Trichoplax adhaerens]|eukprot:XP_002115890.1 expressed hypothetical protein [Trichoplax adhaerens]
MCCSYVSRMPKPGETIEGHKFEVGFGGKGANQCIMAAKLGATTAMIARVGDDTFGSSTIENFKENGVDISKVMVTSNISTGVAPIIVNDEGENSIVIVSGANKLLSIDDVKAAGNMMSNAKVVACQLEIPLESVYAALKTAKEFGAKTILNTAPANKDLDVSIFKFVDILCLNETETEIMTGLAVSNVDEAKKSACILAEKGPEYVLITLGKQGAVIAGKDGKPPVHVEGVSVKAVDTTGAGDAFVGSIAYFMAKHPQLLFAEIVKRSCHVAAVSVCRKGTQKSYPSAEDLPKDLFQ